MHIKIELLKRYIIDFFKFRIEDLNIDASQIADTTATKMLGEIQRIVKNDRLSDFGAMEKIVRVFERYHIDPGVRHDF